MSPRALRHLRTTDAVMDGLIRRCGPMKLKPRRLPPFQSLVHSVIHQQLNGKAAETILGRFQRLFGDGRAPTPEELLAAPAERLREAGLSRQKATYLRDVAAKTLNGLIPSLEECDSLNQTEVIERLTRVKGVGQWTAQMFLMFNLGRPDVLPVLDLGIRKGFQRAYEKRKLPEPEHLERYGERWRPYRTTAAWYLWQAADLPPATT